MTQLAGAKEEEPFAVGSGLLERLVAQCSPCRHSEKACTGSPGEMVTEGGETTFVSRMVHESRELREQIR